VGVLLKIYQTEEKFGTCSVLLLHLENSMVPGRPTALLCPSRNFFDGWRYKEKAVQRGKLRTLMRVQTRRPDMKQDPTFGRSLNWKMTVLRSITRYNQRFYFDSHSQKQPIMDPSEHATFFRHLRSELPSSFRVNTSSIFRHIVAKRIDEICADLTGISYTPTPEPDAITVEVEPPRPLKWYAFLSPVCLFQ
jgi:hypothetical protein